jgi:hypothetical protein
LSLLIQWPLLAALPGVFFLGLYWVARRRWAAYAGIAWLLYAMYELGMQLRWLCTGECNIRIDLLVLYPVLAALSLAAIISAARGRRARQGGP